MLAAGTSTGQVWLWRLADRTLLASGGGDGTVRLWETSTDTPLLVLRSGGRYEGLDVTGLTGVAAAGSPTTRA